MAKTGSKGKKKEDAGALPRKGELSSLAIEQQAEELKALAAKLSALAKEIRDNFTGKVWVDGLQKYPRGRLLIRQYRAAIEAGISRANADT